MLTKIRRLRRVALLVALVLLASCTAESGVVEQRAERPTASADAAEAQPEPSTVIDDTPDSTEPEPDATSTVGPVDPAPDPADPAAAARYGPFVHASNEAVFALDPSDGSAVLLGRRDKQPAIQFFSPTNVANGSLYWIIEATPDAFGANVQIDGSAIIRTDLRTGESVRFVELGEIDTGSERRGYRLAMVSDHELLIEFDNVIATSGAEFHYHRFDAVTGEAVGDFAANVLAPVACTDGVRFLRLQARADGTILTQSAGALGVLDVTGATVETLLPCDAWPTYGDYLSDSELAALVVDGHLALQVQTEDVAALDIAPLGAGSPIVVADGDIWWITGGAVSSRDDPTSQSFLKALVRFDPETKAVVQIWPLGDPQLASLPADSTVEGLHVVDGRVALQLRLDGTLGHLAVLEDSGPTWSIASIESVPGLYVTSPLMLQPGTNQLLIRRDSRDSALDPELLSLVTIDVDSTSLGQEVAVVDLATIAALPAPMVPGVDPSRIWPGLRELGSDETVRFVPSQAMAPTVNNGDAIIASSTLEPQIGDLVLFRPPQGTASDNDVLKRIVASGGQTVAIVDNRLIVDGVAVDEPYLAEPNSTRPRLQIPGCVGNDPKPDVCEVPPNTFFMMGDNRLGSSDSRVYGPIAADAVVGVVVEIVTG